MAIDITTLSPAVLKAKNVATESYVNTSTANLALTDMSNVTTIDGGKITTGKIQSNNGNTYFDLNNNQIKMNNGSFTLDSTAVGNSTAPNIQGAYIKGSTIEGATISSSTLDTFSLSFSNLLLLTDVNKNTHSRHYQSLTTTSGSSTHSFISYNYFDMYTAGYSGANNLYRIVESGGSPYPIVTHSSLFCSSQKTWGNDLVSLNAYLCIEKTSIIEIPITSTVVGNITEYYMPETLPLMSSSLTGRIGIKLVGTFTGAFDVTWSHFSVHYNHSNL